MFLPKRTAAAAGLLLLAALPARGALTKDLVAGGLAWPVFVTSPPGDDRLFIVEQPGTIRIVENGTLLPDPFLDIDSLVGGASQYSERGLLGLAFDPAYAGTGRFYVDYTDLSGNTVVSRYTVDGGDPNHADHSSKSIVLTEHQPFANHNGGMLAFGPDGYLYIGFGDGGSSGDPDERAQNKLVRLGKILRIDVSELPFTVPADNPFVGNPNALPEIWDYGVRNPWRFSFDRMTGDLWIGDVGQNLYEEVDFEPAASGGGVNYGWDKMEGFHCFEPPTDCGPDTLTLPVHEYSHPGGNCSITGGYRYRGVLAPEIDGLYLFGDYCSNRIWAIAFDGDTVTAVTNLTPQLNSTGDIAGLSSFGEDAAGELYLVSRGTGANGAVYRVRSESTNIDGSSSLPSTLRLGRARPNPFGSVTRFDLAVDRAEPLTVRVYDVTGRRVATIYDGVPPAGDAPLEWDGRDSSGRSMPSGVYFIRAERSDGPAAVRRVQIVR